MQKLAKAIQRLEVPGQHIQGAWARDRYGDMVPPTHPSACGWCALGAMDKEEMTYPEQAQVANLIREEASHFIYRGLHILPGYLEPVYMVNDHPNGKEKILELLRGVVHANLPKGGDDVAVPPKT